MRRIGLRDRTILVIGYALFLAWGYPGFLSTDSQNQLMEARTGVFSDAHPPLMSAIWRVLDMIVSGPILMLLLQGALLLGGLFVILKRFFTPRGAAIAACGILLFPPVLAPMAVIWKDSLMAGFLVAGTAALLDARLRVRLGGLALLVAACAVRHNGFAAIVPLVFFLFEWRIGMRWWRRIAVTATAAVLAVGAMVVVTKVLTVQPMKLTPAFQDIVGVIAFSDDKPDAVWLEVLRGVPLKSETGIQARCRRLYALRGAWRITQDTDALMHYPRSQAEWDAMSRAWKELVLDDPRAYFAFHWDMYARVLGIDEIPRAPVYNLFLEVEGAVEELQHAAGYSAFQAHGGLFLNWIAGHTPLFYPYFYAILGIVLLVFFVRDRLTAGLLTSGFLYELSFFPVGADPDSRYSHWLITTVVIATVILIAQRMRKKAA